MSTRLLLKDNFLYFKCNCLLLKKIQLIYQKIKDYFFYKQEEHIDWELI